jgi:hypothetical protein
MSFLKKVIAHWTKSKDPNSSRFRHDMAEKISGYPVKYVTEKHGDNDDVIGRRGSINIKRETDELIVSTPAETIMRCDIDEMQAWILMSGDGVVITAPDKEHGGEVRTVTVHYVYYRK